MIRTLDILFSLLAVLLLSPVLALVTLVLLCTGEHQVLYRQIRVGRQDRPFNLLKFASMKKDSEMSGGLLTTENDSRVLPFGRFLRATKLNELPQLFNVLCGDMSVIGPRPQVKAHYDFYNAHVKAKLATVRPGLSGSGSIVFRNEQALYDGSAENADDLYEQKIAPYKGEAEAWYVDNYSIKNYLKLILLTIEAVIRPGSMQYTRWLENFPEPPEHLKKSMLSR